MDEIIFINIVLGILATVTIGWVWFVCWVNADQLERKQKPHFWNTITLFTGPVGYVMYLLSKVESKNRCPTCGYKLPRTKTKLAVCPKCHHPLSAAVVSNIFVDSLRKFDERSLRIIGKEMMTQADIPGIEDQWSSIRAAKMLIANAILDRATDIHLEPEAESLRVRYRIDGVLHEIVGPPKELQSGIIPCIKVMADLDIAERRKPLDGRFQVEFNDTRIDIRVSTSPTIYGEKLALRLLDRKGYLLALDSLGIQPEVLTKFRRLIERPQGMILVTGPTGCGKTSTLYSALSALDVKSKNIITIEEPVEYQLDGINQIPINPKADITFASGIRSILRQDPDVIMVGEIRDAETAQIAIQAALTGHLIFSTLHTNDAVGTIIRLMDIGVEPYLISGSLLAVMAQRLVRCICQHCKEPHTPKKELLEEFNLPLNTPLFSGKGCELCKYTGYSGRTGIFELLIIDDMIREMIDRKESAVIIRSTAIKNGMQTLAEDGIIKAKRGTTTLEEVAQAIST
ncbi:MAG: GspE/PulE family protein [bacterium]|nr:GspE/PulE family protein [bacterium]